MFLFWRDRAPASLLHSYVQPAVRDNESTPSRGEYVCGVWGGNMWNLFVVVRNKLVDACLFRQLTNVSQCSFRVASMYPSSFYAEGRIVLSCALVLGNCPDETVVPMMIMTLCHILNIF